MGHEVASGADWLPGELEALLEMEPPDEEPAVPDLQDPSAPDPSATDPDNDDLGDPDGWFECASVRGPVVDRFAAAVARLRADLDELVGLATEPGLGLAERDVLITWVQELERSRNRLQIPDQVLVNLMEASGCRIDGPIGLFASPQGFMSALLGIPVGQARARVQAAELFAPTVGTNGQRVPARYPVLADAVASGEISPDRVSLLAKALVEWEKLLSVGGNSVTAESLAEAEELLAGQARVFGGRQLEQVIGRVGDWLVPDGMLDDRPAQDAVRELQVRPIGRGMHKGMYRVEGRLTAEAGAKAMAVLDPLSKPQPVLDGAGHIIDPDRRDRGQRMHDALEEVMDRCLRAGDLPAHGGTPTTLILIAEEDEFVATSAASGQDTESGAADSPAAAGRVAAGAHGSVGSAVTETGDELPMDLTVALADEAEIVRTVFDKQTGDVLNLGRTRRLASYAQTLALAARDGGCTFPGCSKSPKWCQRHHIVDWVKGGPTDLPNLTLLCSFHHYRFARHGWSAEYRHGRVWWRPPKIIDPDQKPILNPRRRDYPLIT